MAVWQRALCVVVILAGGATMIANGAIMYVRANKSMEFSHRLDAIRARGRQIETPGFDDSSRLRCEMAHRDLEREEKEVYAERAYASEGYAVSQSFVTLAAAMGLFATGLTLGFVWRRRTPPAGGSNAPTAG